MGVRCSLFGCAYGDSDIEREREERGREVVLTVREYEVCTRCGDTRVISENTGVTSLGDGATGSDVSIGDEAQPRPHGAGGTDRSEDTPTWDGNDDSAMTTESPATSPGDSPVTDSRTERGSVTAADLDGVDPDESAHIFGDDDSDAPDGDPETADETGPGAVIQEAEPESDGPDGDSSTDEAYGSPLEDAFSEAREWPDPGRDRGDDLDDGDGGAGSDDPPATHDSSGPNGPAPATPTPPTGADGSTDTEVADEGESTNSGTDEAATDDGIILDETAEDTFESHVGVDPGTAADGTSWSSTDGSSAGGRSQGAGGNAGPTENDAVIMDRDDPDTHTQIGTDLGEWPSVGTEQSARSQPDDFDDWPDPSANGGDLTPSDGGDTATDTDTDTHTDTDPETDRIPPRERGTGPDVAADTDSKSGETRRSGAVAVAGIGPDTEAVGNVLACTSCQHSIQISNTPHASGDICPECANGYLTGE